MLCLHGRSSRRLPRGPGRGLRSAAHVGAGSARRRDSRVCISCCPDPRGLACLPARRRCFAWLGWDSGSRQLRSVGSEARPGRGSTHVADRPRWVRPRRAMPERRAWGRWWRRRPWGQRWGGWSRSLLPPELGRRPRLLASPAPVRRTEDPGAQVQGTRPPTGSVLRLRAEASGLVTAELKTHREMTGKLPSTWELTH